MSKTSQETINAIVWKACDTFRGKMDSSQYKDYVFTIEEIQENDYNLNIPRYVDTNI